MLRTRLGIMMFLQFFIWGGWFVTLGTFLSQNLNASGSQIGMAFSTQSWGAIIAPFIIGLIARFTFGWPVRWVGKHTIFRAPFGRFFRWLGGIPINRSRPGGFIDDVVARIQADPHAIVCIAPEGTRSYVEGWKSGFHRIARTAKVPIALGYIDWGRRCVGIAGYVQPTDDIEADLAAIRAGYASVTAFYPEKAGRIAIR